MKFVSFFYSVGGASIGISTGAGGGGGLDGIINAAGAVANATGTIVNSGQVLANNIATNAGNLSNNIRDAGSTNAAREARAEAQERFRKGKR